MGYNSGMQIPSKHIDNLIQWFVNVSGGISFASAIAMAFIPGSLGVRLTWAIVCGVGGTLLSCVFAKSLKSKLESLEKDAATWAVHSEHERKEG